MPSRDAAARTDVDDLLDYLHLTKRFGAIAVSQFPIQYLLALKSLNPFAFVFQSSHEQVNRWHRVLGRLIYALLCMHAMLYLNYFIQMTSIPSQTHINHCFSFRSNTFLYALRTQTQRIIYIRKNRC